MQSLRFRYQTLEFEGMDIHVRTLRDVQEFLDVDGVAEKVGIYSAQWSIFGVIWASGEVLAHHVETYEIEGKRILEVGCGIGLASLVLNHRSADITATDYHPESGNFLAENTKLNQDELIPFVRTAWEDEDSGMGKFDMVIGSDILYESQHAEALSNFIDQHANPHCEVILVDPGRGHHAKFSKKMVKLGYTHSQHKVYEIMYSDRPFQGQILSYVR